MPRPLLLVVPLFAWPGLALAQNQCQAPVPPSSAAIADIGPVASPPGAGPEALPAVAIAASPILSRLASHGAVLSALPPAHGMRTVFARNGNQFQVFYLTPDDHAAIGGVMWDAEGHDITRDQVTPIQGTIPTIRWTPDKRSAAGTADAETAVDPFKRLGTTSYGLAGRPGARQLYMVIDPLCPFSTRALSLLQPAIDKGAIELAIVPISINDHENDNASTPAALDLIGAGRTGMVDAWRAIARLGHARPDHPPPADAKAQLQLNMSAAHAIGLRGTPTLVWQDAAGTGHAQSGMGSDDAAVAALLAGMGG